VRFFFFGRRNIDKNFVSKQQGVVHPVCSQRLLGIWRGFGLFLGYVISTPLKQSPKYHVYVGIVFVAAFVG
jgi:hypothetical protein